MRKITGLLFLSFFLLFAITSSGGFESGDARTRYETAKSFAAGGDGALHVRAGYTGVVPNKDGTLYSVFGSLQAVLMVPGIVVTSLLPIAPAKADALSRLSFNLIVIPFLSASALAILFLALVELQFSPRIAFVTVGTIGIGTPFWEYARCAQEENIVALGLALWLFGMARFQSGKHGNLSVAALGGCVAFGARWAAVATLLPLLVLTAGLVWKKRGRELPAAASLSAVTIAVLLGYNMHRFGTPFETGYGILFRSFGTSVLSFSDFGPRVVALLFSPYKGLFLYAPVLIFCVMQAIRGPLRRWDLAAGLLAMGGTLVLNAVYREWTSGYSWGPRFLVAPIVLLAPLLASFFEARRPLPKRMVGLIAFSVAWQFFSVLLPASTEEIYRMRNNVRPSKIETAWRTEYTPLSLRVPWALRAIGNTVTGNPGVILPEGAEDERVALGSSDYQTIFWWPFRFAFRFGIFDRFLAAAICAVFLSTSGWLARLAWIRVSVFSRAAPAPAAAR